jgi:thiol-disulfide isomerase/thioredoxin
MRLLSGIAIAIVFAACSAPKPELKTGLWRGVITLQGKELPFNFEVLKDSSGNFNVNIKNADEKLLLDEVSVVDDSVFMKLHIFDAQLSARINGDSLSGLFIKTNEQNYKLPFKAVYGQDFRFSSVQQSSKVNFSGKYAVKFIHEGDTADAVGIFNQTDNYVTGTFLRPSGDYRYLEGNIVDDVMMLSTFDGNHAYLFSAKKINDSTLSGDYWSGKSRHDSWVGTRNEKAALPDAESLTYLKEGYDKIDFSFPDLTKNLIRPTDEKYKGKVVILQLFGSWCPNCMDETKFLAPWYDTNKNRGIEIIGLAYEAKPDFEYAAGRVRKMKEKLRVNYDFVIAGTKDNAEASKTLPMLNSVIAFPTTIFIGKDGKVKKIHTGFSGPATGVYYDQFVQHFNETVNELVGQ